MEDRSFTIHVTQEIIDNAKRNHSRKCMVAEAIRDQIPGCSGIDVSAEATKFNLPDPKTGELVKYNYVTPGLANKNICEYDTNGPGNIKPFKIKLQGSQLTTRIVKPHKKKRDVKGIKSTRSASRSAALCRRLVVRRRHGHKEVVTV